VQSDIHPILILGAGINGAALARELVLNRVPVVLVDTADIACGTTAYSSRLIHGGLRYLEYGEFSLVRESLAERTRLLQLAPHLVHPLQLFIPVENRWRGFLTAAARFLHWPAWLAKATPPRGAWLVRAGLWMYDTYARDPSLPKHASHALGSAGTPAVDPQRYVSLCSYYDAQVRFPERFTLALVEDARRVAAENQTPFEVLTYHVATRRGASIEIRSVGAEADAPPTLGCEPAAIINATGAWVDETLARIGATGKRLIGGTRGSHILTSSPRVRELLGGNAIYAEAPDGRPVFLLPFGDATLVGTTDLPFEGDPATAIATPGELDYLLATVNTILPKAQLTADDIDLHYCGVRPLPYVDAATPGAITRRHWTEELPGTSPPVFSVIGGKLTTCRSLAQETTAQVLGRLGRKVVASSERRMLPGAEAYPRDPAARDQEWQAWAKRFGLSRASLDRITALVGTRAVNILSSLPDTGAPTGEPISLLAGTDIPHSFAAWIIQHEWVTTLDDLVERRLLLMFDHDLSEACLRELAELLVAAGRLAAGDVDSAVESTVARLRTHFGKRVHALDQC